MAPASLTWIPAMPNRSTRLHTVDVLRGLIMVVMALDHTRDYFHHDAFVFDPTNLEKTHAALFFTRWITHFCMPGFVLLAGLSMALALQHKNKKELSGYLLSRGLWLIVLDVTVLRFAYFFNFYYDVTFLSVLWLFGVGMIVMSAFIHLPRTVLLVFGSVLFLFHDLSALVTVAPRTPLHALWTVLMRVGFIPLSADVSVLVTYPIIPWLSVMVLGFCMGTWFEPTEVATHRRKSLQQVGGALIVLFVVLRWFNVGDPAPWSVQSSPTFTLLSFLNVSKYPPSLPFLLITLGPLLLLLAWLEGRSMKALNPLRQIGRVPLFYFIVHFFLIHTMALLSYLYNTGQSWGKLDFHFSQSFGGITPAGGVTLVWVYAWWAVVVAVMYFLCRWFDAAKSRGTSSWWRFL
ncbi:MAG: DUF1624 domain-containing protein [Bacteroidota bacterium]